MSAALIGDRYRLEEELSHSAQGVLWRASDLLAGEAPMVLRQLAPGQDQQRFRELWGRLQGVLHPQVPRFGGIVQDGDSLWLVREWQGGPTYQELLEARRERQLVFGSGEVLLLLRQLLPVLAVLHSQELLHGDLTPANLLRRDRDGLPVLLDFGLVRGVAANGSETAGLLGATPGFAPPELVRGAPAQPWMDLHSLGVVALVLLSGQEPAELLDPITLAWRLPAGLEPEPGFREALLRLLASDPSERFASAAVALQALQQLPMPESTGPVARADRTVVLVPQASVPPPPPPTALTQNPAPPSSAASVSPAPPPELPTLRPLAVASGDLPPRSRQEQKEEEAEGRLWPVVIALVLSAVVGTALGWLLLSRGKTPATPDPAASLQLPASLPPAEVDQRQQLLNRLRALQIDRTWFLKLVDGSLLAQFPERGGRLPSDSLEDAPLRKVWNELAEEWLARVEQLPPELRRRLGSFSAADWQTQQTRLGAQGLSPAVLRQLVSGSAQNLLPGRSGEDIPPEPFRQLWYAAAQKSLANVQIEQIPTQVGQTRVLSAQVEAGGARLFPIQIAPGSRLVLGVNGSPLMQMSVFGADGALLEAKGPLRVISLDKITSAPVQLLITNEGVAAALITLSLRVDPAPAVEPTTPTTPGEPTPSTPTPATPAPTPTPTPAPTPSPPSGPMPPPPVPGSEPKTN
ncbi:protein kinase domain-containing protein [Cyanobium sp. Morenito 9A2]|uniref:serine/threonine protein kinase n=1 Tax=Cyanobium sp. Morenito 9A2 TaxID=2823718 RepID=UPI0020CBB1AF|nr:protein kinase [Cyanobium sp. Morenito 9A2]MCP9849507.1 protein kinase [Cyanobium sp. Morenito 9A2]